MQAIPVGGMARTVSGTAESAPNVEGPLGGAGHDLSRMRALEASGVLIFMSGTPKGL